MSTTISDDLPSAAPAPLAAPRTLWSGCLTMLSWGLLGLLLGAGSGYFMYVKKPAEFQSSALLQVSGGDAASQAGAMVILSDPVLLAATREGGLDRLPGLQPPASNRALSPVEFVAFLRERARLRVVPLETSTPGSLYELYAHAATPSGAETVTQAVVTAYLDYLSNEDEQVDWQTAMQQLQTTRNDALTRITDLEQQLQRRPAPANASLQGDDVVSAAAEQWKRLQAESQRLHADYRQATARLRQTEALIADGAAAEQVLAALGTRPPANPGNAPAALDGSPAAADNSPASPDDSPAAMDNSAAAARRQTILAERQRIMAEVERDLVPLREERERLLKIVASAHPKVRGVETRMQKVRQRLDNLPELPPDADLSANAPPANAPPANAPPSTGSPVKAAEAADLPLLSSGTLITRELRALRRRRDDLSRQITDIDAELDQAAQRVSQQKAELQENARLRSEIQVQQQLVAGAMQRLAELPAAPVQPATRAQVLRAPQPGIQVAPWVWSHVLVGAAAGWLSAMVLAGLVLLTAGAAPAP